MKTNRCPNCGEVVSESWKIDGPRHVCPICGAISYFEDLGKAKATDAELRAIYSSLENLDFQKALELLSSLKESFPDDSRLYFLSALAKHRACYTLDARSDKRIPTLNDLSDEDISLDEDAKLSLSKAESPMVAENYRECFHYLDEKRHEIVKAKDEYSYDVFLSVKVHQVDASGNPVLDSGGNPIQTQDCSYAFELYRYLRDKFPDLRVFFSESSEAKVLMAGNRYENIIYAALHSAKLFLLIAESGENIAWRWVRNEWKRYLFSLEHDRGKGDRRLVVVTSKLKERDLPLELQGNQFIDASKAFSSTNVLEGVVRDLCYKTRRIEAKTFEEVVPQVTLSPQMEKAITKQLKRYGAVASTSLQATLERIEVDLNPEYPEIRAEAFLELEHLLQEHKDLYPARKMLLLKGTDIARFDDYITSPKLIFDCPDIMKSFLDFASEEDGSLALTTLANTLGEKDNLKQYGSKVYYSIIKDQILPYREVVDKNALKKIVDCVKDSYGELLDDPHIYELIQETLHLWDYADPKGYSTHRISFVDVMMGQPAPKAKRKKSRKKADENAPEPAKDEEKPASQEADPRIEYCRKMLTEAFLAQSEDYRLAYRTLCLGLEGAKSYEEARNDFLYCGNLFANAALNKDKLNLILSLLRYGEEGDRRFFLSVFLFALTQDGRTEGKSDGADEELSPYALFLRYIGYPLPEEFPVKEDHLVVNKDTPIDPSPEAYRYKDHPSTLDGLLSIYGYELHKRGRYADAKEIYGYYLGEQGEGASGPDDCLIRCYMALCNCGDPSFAALSAEKDVFDHRALNDELIGASKSHPEVKFLYDKVRDAYIAYHHRRESYENIRPLVEEFETLRTWDSLKRSTEVHERLKAMIEESPEEYRPFQNRIEDLRMPYDQAMEASTKLLTLEYESRKSDPEVACRIFPDLLPLFRSRVKKLAPGEGLKRICLREDAPQTIEWLKDYGKKARFLSEEGKNSFLSGVDKAERKYEEAMKEKEAFLEKARPVIKKQKTSLNALAWIGSIILMFLVGGVTLGLLASPLLFLLPEQIRTFACLAFSFALPVVGVGANLWCHFDEKCQGIDDFDVNLEWPTCLFRFFVPFLPFIVPFAAIAVSISDYFFLGEGVLRIVALLVAYSGVLIPTFLGGLSAFGAEELKFNQAARFISFVVASVSCLLPLAYCAFRLYGGWSNNAFEVGFLTGYGDLPLWAKVCTPVGVAVAVLLGVYWLMNILEGDVDDEEYYTFALGALLITGTVVLSAYVPYALCGSFGSFALLFAAWGGTGSMENVGWSFLYGFVQLVPFAAAYIGILAADFELEYL